MNLFAPDHIYLLIVPPTTVQPFIKKCNAVMEGSLICMVGLVIQGFFVLEFHSKYGLTLVLYGPVQKDSYLR